MLYLCTYEKDITFYIIYNNDAMPGFLARCMAVALWSFPMAAVL